MSRLDSTFCPLALEIELPRDTWLVRQSRAVKSRLLSPNMFFLAWPTNWSKRPPKYGSPEGSDSVPFSSILSYSHRVSNQHALTDMPDHLRFNPWIRKGYRASDLSTLECIQSICFWHNETINIATHGFAILYVVIFQADLFAEVIKLPSYLTYCHMISCLSPWLGSFLYHVFMNHRSGEPIYERLLQADMAGIWVTQTFGALTTLNASFIALGDSVKRTIIAFYLCLSLWTLNRALTGRNAWQRAFSFSLMVCVRAVAFVVRLTTTEHRSHLTHIIMQELWPILGATLSAARIPERFYPGSLDLVFNSHNIMHCMVVFGAVHMHFAFLTDIQIICGWPH